MDCLIFTASLIFLTLLYFAPIHAFEKKIVIAKCHNELEGMVNSKQNKKFEFFMLDVRFETSFCNSSQLKIQLHSAIMNTNWNWGYCRCCYLCFFCFIQLQWNTLVSAVLMDSSSPGTTRKKCHGKQHGPSASLQAVVWQFWTPRS